MATFKIVLDKRTKQKEDKYNLAVRFVNGNDVMYLNVAKMTEKKYEQVFIKKVKDEASITFRETCDGYITKCERIYAEIKPFSKERLRELFYKKENELDLPQTLKLTDLFDYYIKHRTGIKLKTKDRYHTTMNVLETFKKGITVGDITPKLLDKFDAQKRSEGCSIPTVISYLTDLRSIINYFTKVVKLIPKSYEYPFGKGGYSIQSFFPKKLVMKNHETKLVVDFTDFETPQQEYARDIWLFLYRCNGINFADLLRMRWANIQGGYFVFFRMKTENTRRNNIKEIVAPITPKVQELLDKIGVKDSPFILGKIKEDYTEQTFNNKSHKMRQQINRDLSVISRKLKLSVPLKLMTARDTYATTLKRAGKSNDQIGEMLGHSNSIVTMHYLGSMDMETTAEVNESLF